MKDKLLIISTILMLLPLHNTSATEKYESICLEPITVTASRCERKISHTASNINIISSEEIKQSYTDNIPGLLQNIEGIHVYDTSGAGTSPRMNMRGFWGGMSSHQLVLIDGIPQNKSEDKLIDWNLISLNNIKQIEILKGSTSAFYGENAMAGVINIITKSPSFIPQADLSTAYGSFNTQNYNLSASTTLGEIGYLLSASRKSTDGFRRHNDYDDFHLNGKLNWDSKIANLDLSLNYHEKKRGAQAWQLTEEQLDQDRRNARPGTENDKGKDEKIQVGLTLNKDISQNQKIKSTLYTQNQESDSFYTNTSLTTTEQIKDETVYGLLSQYTLNYDMLNLSHCLTLGIDLEKNEFDLQKYSAPYQTRGSIQSDYSVSREKIGPFIQNEIDFDSLTLIGGLRYDLVKFNFKNFVNDNLSKKRNLSDISPKLGLVYRYNEKSNIYTNYSYAFRTPTLAQIFTYDTSNPDLNPEEAANYELGIRHYFNPKFKSNISVFYTDLKNEITYENQTYTNIGQTSHAGIESHLDYQLSKEVSGFLTYTYLRAKYETGDNDDNYLAHIPKHTGNLGICWDWDSGLKAKAILNYTGSSYLDEANTSKLSDFTTVDTKLSYTINNWSTYLSISNILDKEYNLYGYLSGGTKKFNPAPGRTFTLGINTNF
jgi:TonB-dependent siderophore receptor